MINSAILLGLSIFLWTGPGSTPPADPDVEAQRLIDTSQASWMLQFFKAISAGKPAEDLLQPVMDARGTDLLIGQMNLARKVSKDQYDQLLRGLMTGTRPDLQPVDSTRRAQRGVDGLMQDVWPALSWGVSNIPALEERIRHLETLDLYESARAMAEKFLPGPLEAPARVFAVMGGRAGGAKLGEADIYMDVLVYSFRGRRFGEYPSDSELVSTVAHEMHHMGFGPYLVDLEKRLDLSQAQRLQFRFLSGLIAEGSATYLISENRSLAGMETNRMYAEYLAKPEDLMSQTERILEAIQDGRIGTDAEYEEATADFLGGWFHSAGSLLLGVIDEVAGLPGIEGVLEDPRLLVSAYNGAVASMGPAAPTPPFDPGLAESIRTMGRGGTTLPRPPGRHGVGVRLERADHRLRRSAPFGVLRGWPLGQRSSLADPSNQGGQDNLVG